jgi:deoxyribodipyrimidine photo-lyase
MWFRSDLRVRDNKALYHAVKNHKNGVMAIYCCCPDQWKEHGWGSPKVDFILRQLQELSQACLELNIGLKIVYSNWFAKSVKDVIAFAKKHKVSHVYYNREIEFNERQRDKSFEVQCEKESLETVAYQDSCILTPKTIRNLQDRPYSVFTPFKKRWLEQLEEVKPTMYSKPQKLPKRVSEPSEPPKTIKGFSKVNYQWPVGEKVAQKKLKLFLSDSIRDYQKQRDYPGIQGTSQLSVYLANGVISARTCYLSSLDDTSTGAETWRSELIWREFYRHLMVDVPRLSKGRAFKLETEKLPWSHDRHKFEKWSLGRTGFPLIDAAMRQLRETHWMHNRLRMLVAMFLTKNLGLHWSLGESFFAEQLVDYDLAANNGGWQWSASTGCDAAPYFRVFNPITQSLKFDAGAEFIKSYCPELEALAPVHCHEPHKKGKNLFAPDYPMPMVDLKATRLKAIDMFKNSKFN